MRTMVIAIALLTQPATALAQDRVIDTHVQFLNGEGSIRAQEAQTDADGRSVS